MGPGENIVAAISGTKNAIELVSLIAKAGLTLDAAETKMQLASLKSQLADNQVALAQAKMDISDLELTIRNLNIKSEKESEMVFEGYSYMRVVDGTKDGPFCQRCWDSERKQIRLYGFQDGTHGCKSCQCQYGVKPTSSRPRQADTSYNIFTR